MGTGRPGQRCQSMPAVRRYTLPYCPKGRDVGTRGQMIAFPSTPVPAYA